MAFLIQELIGTASIFVVSMSFFDVAEYVGNVPAEKREEVIQQLNKEVEKLIKVSCQSISTMSY